MRHVKPDLCAPGHLALHLTALVYHKILDPLALIKMGPQTWYHTRTFLAGPKMSRDDISAATYLEQCKQTLADSDWGTHDTRRAACQDLYTEQAADLPAIAALTGHKPTVPARNVTPPS